MLEVRFLRKSGKLIAYTFDGHAGYEDYGRDIVCAAVTAQCMMIYNGIDEILKIPNRLDMDNDGGYFSMSIDKASSLEKEEAQVLMETLKMGIEAIVQQYGDYIKLIEEEV